MWVYGSRLDDQRRGGDHKLALEHELQISVDILVYQRGQKSSAFQAIALSQAVQLEKAA